MWRKEKYVLWSLLSKIARSRQWRGCWSPTSENLHIALVMEHHQVSDPAKWRRKMKYPSAEPGRALCGAWRSQVGVWWPKGSVWEMGPGKQSCFQAPEENEWENQTTKGQAYDWIQAFAEANWDPIFFPQKNCIFIWEETQGIWVKSKACFAGRFSWDLQLHCLEWSRWTTLNSCLQCLASSHCHLPISLPSCRLYFNDERIESERCENAVRIHWKLCIEEAHISM